METQPNASRSALRRVRAFLLLLPALPAAVQAGDQGTETAARFARLFLAGPSEEIHAMMTPQMQSAFGPAQHSQLLAGLDGQLGALGQLGAAWYEDTVQGYRRYRVPAEFERGKVDFRVVLDGAGKVAGLFTVPHSEPPSEAEPAAAEAAGPADDAVAPGPEIEVRVGAGETGLPGLLTLPKGAGPSPGVVLVHGSGPNDRDETIGPNKPFRDLAWGLAERGIATLRYDKRSLARPQDLIAAGAELTVEEEVIADARAALALLRERPEVDGGRLFVLGHSLGGTLVPRIAQEPPRPAGLISLAGSTLPLPEKVLTQTRYIAAIDGELSDQEQAAIAEVEQAVKALRAALDGTGPAPEKPLFGVPIGYYRDLDGYDPPSAAAALGLPILVLQGERDYQVTMEDFDRWRSALSGRPGACLKAYEGLDHLFRSGTGPSGPEDYQRPAPLAPQVVDDLAAWIRSGRCP